MNQDLSRNSTLLDLLLVYNDSMTKRTPLTAALSTDADKTWPDRRNVGENDKESYAYPSAVQTRDGKIHASVTRYSLDQAGHAYTAMHDGTLAGRAVIVP